MSRVRYLKALEQDKEALLTAVNNLLKENHELRELLTTAANDRQHRSQLQSERQAA